MITVTEADFQRVPMEFPHHPEILCIVGQDGTPWRLYTTIARGYRYLLVIEEGEPPYYYRRSVTTFRQTKTTEAMMRVLFPDQMMELLL